MLRPGGRALVAAPSCCPARVLNAQAGPRQTVQATAVVLCCNREGRSSALPTSGPWKW